MKLVYCVCVCCLFLLPSTRLDRLFVWILLSGSFLFFVFLFWFLVFVFTPSKKQVEKTDTAKERKKRLRDFPVSAVAFTNSVPSFGGWAWKCKMLLKNYNVVVVSTKKLNKNKCPKIVQEVESISNSCLHFESHLQKEELFKETEKEKIQKKKNTQNLDQTSSFIPRSNVCLSSLIFDGQDVLLFTVRVTLLKRCLTMAENS